VRAQSTFWLGRPWLFRPVIKGLLFFVSFVFSNSIYFAAMFGPTSCFFSRTGFQGPQFLSWWVSDPAEPPHWELCKWAARQVSYLILAHACLSLALFPSRVASCC